MARLTNGSLVAGDQVTVEMHQQPGDRSCANEAIGGDHYGPINVSLSLAAIQAHALNFTITGPRSTWPRLTMPRQQLARMLLGSRWTRWAFPQATLTTGPPVCYFPVHHIEEGN